MGTSVRTPSKDPPKQTYLNECPHCGHQRRVINGAWLRWVRERAGIDQRTLAKRIGISGPYLSDLERNRRECPEIIRREYQKLWGRYRG